MKVLATGISGRKAKMDERGGSNCHNNLGIQGYGASFGHLEEQFAHVLNHVLHHV
jgi:hypothetical protein